LFIVAINLVIKYGAELYINKNPDTDKVNKLTKCGDNCITIGYAVIVYIFNVRATITEQII
jgi:hypothetical protein